MGVAPMAFALGCSGPATSPGDQETVARSAAALTSDSGAADAGLDCGGGTPTTGIDAGSVPACLGALAQATFTAGVCSCGAITATAGLTTDGFNSTVGPPDGGIGGDVSSVTGQTWSSVVHVGGNLIDPGTLALKGGASTVAENAWLAGTVSGTGILTISGTEYVPRTPPSNVRAVATVLTTKTPPVECNCSSLVPTASIVAAHQSSNDNATIGLSTTAATGSATTRINLTCGNFYLTQINMTAPLTVAVHGHAALYVGGNVASNNAVTFSIDPTATLDLFVSGTFKVTSSVTLGSTAYPAQCRAYVAGSTVSFGGTSSIGCNLYAPSASFSTSSSIPTIYGSLFVSSFTSGVTTTLHYDQAIESASNECCTPGSCDDGNPCTIDSCNGDGTCSHVTASNGTTCQRPGNLCMAGACAAGVCASEAPVVCTAVDQCHTAGTCDPSTGVCSNPTVADGTACNDGNACTSSASCVGGVCTGSNPVACTALDQCHVAGTCDPTTGTCSNPTVADGTTCNDGDACTLSDSCLAGVCTGSDPVLCAASDQCHSAGSCDPTTGACSNPNLADGTACNDANACTLVDSCLGGVCTGTDPVVCSASDECHAAGVCDPTSGVCSNPTAPDGTACNDGNACMQSDSCVGGMCTGSNPVVCAPLDQCHTAGTCNPSSGQCSNPAISGCGATTDAWGQTAGRPSPREGAAVAMAPAMNLLIVFGGANAGQSIGDTWVLNRATGLWSAAASSSPPPRAAAAVAFDTNRNRFVVFGGLQRSASGDVYLSDTWELEPVHGVWTAPTVATAPPARAFAAAAFDASRQRTVVFGGRSPSSTAPDAGIVWEWDGAQWTSRATTGEPAGRSTAAMAFDSARAKMVLFGGESAQAPGVAFNDTWELDSAAAAWTNIAAVNPPPARVGHAAYYDSTRLKTELFGGTSTSQLAMGDTWEYDGPTQAWTQRTTSGAPPARASGGFAFDPATGHGLLFGGVTYSATGAHTPERDDLWEFDPVASTWSLRTARAAPAATRIGAAYDTARSTLVTRGAEMYPQVWELAGGVWTAKNMLSGFDADYGATFASFPGGTGADYGELSRGQSLAYDPGRATTVYFTQGNAAGYQVESSGAVIPIPATPPTIWEWSGAQWTQRSCTGAPPGLTEAGVALDAARERAVIVCGLAQDYSCGTYEVDMTTCTWLQQQPTSFPTPRDNPLLAWDSGRDVVVLLGGTDPNGNLLNDTWEWNGPAATWTQIQPRSPPPARSRAGMTFDPGRGKVVLFGGTSGLAPQQTYYGDVWEYDGAAGTWTQPTPPTPQTPRMDPSLVYDPTRARVEMLAGTSSAGGPAPGLWEWDGTQWTRRWLGAAPAARSGASGGWLAAMGYGAVFGGVRGDGEREFMNDMWIWNGGEWSTSSGAAPQSIAVVPSAAAQATTYVPAPRAGHAFAVGYESLTSAAFGLLFGGETDDGVVNDTWSWNESTFAWSQLPQSGPPARTGHALVALPGTEFFLFGGQDPGGNLLSDDYTWTNGEGWLPATYFNAPPARADHAMAADPVRNKVVLFGGRGASGPLADTWEYDIPTNAWTQAAPAFAPPARFGHSMFYDPNRGTVVLAGGTGSDPNSNFADAWEWDGNAGAWAKLFVTAGFPARAGAVGFFDAAAGSSTVFGGMSYGVGGSVVATYGDAWALNRANELGRNGLPCTSGGSCESGFCADGYCCNTACADQCGSCAVSGSLGTCTAISGAPQDGRPACPGSGTCASSCNGADSLACHPAAAGVSCGGPTCTSGEASAGQTCDGNGNCVPAAPQTCGDLYACNGDTCGTACYKPADCAPGAQCSTCFDGCSGTAGMCYLPVSITSVTYTPANPVVNSPVMVTVDLAGGNGNGPGTTPYVETIYAPPDSGGSFFLGQFTPTEVGNYTISVTAWSYGSPQIAYQDATITIPVAAQ